MKSDATIGGLLWSHFTWRHWRRSARSTLLLVTILALGVAAMFSIRLANRAALDGFRYFSENLTGGSDLILRSPTGQLPVDALPDLRQATDESPVGIFPILESTAALINDSPTDGDGNGKANAPLLRLTGVDFVGLRNAAYLGAEPSEKNKTVQALQFTGTEEGGPQLGSANDAWVADSFARRGKLRVGDFLRLAVDDRIETVRIAGLLSNDPTQAQVPENLLLFDLPGLQQLLDRPNSLTRIEIRVPAGADRDTNLERVRSQITSLADARGWLLETPDERMSTSKAMTGAFRLNLTVLSTLALLVGVYLILQALEAAVVRRRKEIAILRSLGVSSAQVRRAWFFEALALGICGTLLGLVLGWGAAQLSVGNIAKTVSALYHETTTRAAGWHSGEALFAACFGIAASLVAGWLPARDAAATPPVQSLRGGERGGGPRLLRSPWLGAALVAIGWLFCQAPPPVTASGGRIPLGGYLAALSWLTALSILCSILFRPLSSWLGRKQRGGPSSRYAVSQLRQPSGRHRLTAAGLVVAVGMAAGMGILVHSFEGTLSGWIRQLLKADLYVAPAGIGSASSEATLSKATWQALGEDPAVAGIDIIRHYPIEIDGKRTTLAGSEYADHDRSLRLSWRQKPVDPDPNSMKTPTTEGLSPAWISESFAIRFDKQRGDFVDLPTPGGIQRVEITGVYVDYHNESGTVLVNRSFLVDWFNGSEAISNMAVFLNPDADIDTVRERWISKHPSLVIRTNTRLRDEALRVFHQTFAVTHALEAIGIAVAVAGLALTLASLMIERRNEVMTLKQLGMTRRQLATATAIESVGIAGVGTAAGLLLSLALGYVLIHVVNRQSFGWTLQFAVPWVTFVGLALVTLLTSATVGWFIGRNGTHLKAERQE